MYDRLFKRPPAGLSIIEMAKNGSQSARESVIKVVENHKPPAGLSLSELSKLGLRSARERVQIIYDAAGIKSEDL